MTAIKQPPRDAGRPAGAPVGSQARPPGPAAPARNLDDTLRNLTYTIQKGAGSLPFLKK